MGKYVKWFSEINKEDIPIAGGKGANLGEMYQAGFPVPPGFIVTANAYWKFLLDTGLKEEIDEKLRNLNVDNTDELQRVAKEVQQAIVEEEVPHEIAEEIKESYDKMKVGDYTKEVNTETTELIKSWRDAPYVAVRSSATAEDLPDASFAGQQETYLNIKGADDVVKSTKMCWASLFTARAIYYRQKNNFPHMKVKIAVVIQKMVNSEKSGVAFSVNPSNGNRDEIVIEGGYGLGEAIVQGEINPDLYIVDKKSLEIKKKEIKKQERKLVRTETRNVEWVKVPEDEQEKQVLSDYDIIKLARIVRQIEEHYDKPQDIEWAYERNKIYITQSRPITTLDKISKEEVSDEIKKNEEVILHGLGASPGVATGKVVKIFDINELDKIKEGDILVTKMTDPNMVPAMKKAAGIITDEGGMTCHAAIVSRELGTPCIVGTEKATSVLNEGEVITMDATNGVVYRGKSKEILAVKEEKEESSIPYKRTIITGTEIHVNLSTPELAEKVAKKHVDGVGLLRAEFIAAELNMHPTAMLKQGKEQEFIDKFAEGIAKVARLFNPRPVTYRTLDFKTNEYRNLPGGEEYEPEERNPMIGWRGASRYVSKEYIDTFKMELKAIKKVREEFGLTNVEIMIPFVRTIWELKEVLKILENEGIQKKGIKVGIMVEVPSTVILIDKFCELGIDFISIGSNDLTQLILGVDRDNGKLGEWFDERNEAVLRALERVIRICKKHGVKTSICGQAPSVYPEITRFLVEHGIDKISVNPDVIDRTRELVAQIEHKLLLDNNIKRVNAADDSVL